MKHIISFLKHPILKMFVTPIAIILFGLLTGVIETNQINWLNTLYFIIAIISGQFIAHFLNLKNNRQYDLANGILYFCQAVFLVTVILLAFSTHWMITVIILLYGIYIHLLYYPYNLSGNFFHLLLNILYHSLFLNVAAYFLQTQRFEMSDLVNYLPLTLFYTGVQLEVFHQQSQLNNKKMPVFYSKYLNIALMVIGVIFGLFTTTPSRSYYLVQILYIFISVIFILPLVVDVENSHQKQNKINYIYSVYFVFTLFYSLSMMY